MSLFSNMPLWGVALTLMVAFITKYFAVEYILRTPMVEARTTGKGWAGAVNITTALHVILTFLILFLFTGIAAALVIAVLTGVVEYMLGYYRSQHRVPQITTPKLLQAFNYASAIQSFSYTGVIAAVIKFYISRKISG